MILLTAFGRGTLVLVACFVLSFLVLPFNVRADGPDDNDPAKVRAVPPPGESLSGDQRHSLTSRLDAMEAQIRQACDADPDRCETWLPDIAVLTRAVRLALDQNTFYHDRDVKDAERHLDLAGRRLRAARAGMIGLRLLTDDVKPIDGHYMLVGGFRSRIDGSIQPYGVIVPERFVESSDAPRRLDVWLHGRGERELELQFLAKRQKDKGYYAPSDGLTLHPFGRYSNAFKFAGEVDVFEAMARIGQLFTVDPQRTSIRGFSMGGAGCWQFAVHYPGTWLAATPGAGFSETLQFLKGFQGEEFRLNDPAMKLLRWYDCPPWVTNLKNLHVVAYSGELDRQKQAADVMVEAAAAHGMQITHLIGPATEHSIHPESQQEIAGIMQQWVSQGQPVLQKSVDFTTYTLRYPQCDWVRIEGMTQHWEPSRVRGEISDSGEIALQTSGVTHLKIVFTAAQTAAATVSGQMTVDDQSLTLEKPEPGKAWACMLSKTNDGWGVVDAIDHTLRKRPGLQGPIDDALMESFVMVVPSRPCVHGGVERWVNAEMRHFQEEWSRQFRGTVRTVSDQEVTEAMIRDCNLIVFGDPHANRFLAKIANRLPGTWNRETLSFQQTAYPVESSVLAMIYPNPLNPERYVVLNSGFTYRQYAYLNNARQVPHLPDWAILDISAGSTSQLPGVIASSGFFDEQWK
jgi:pimeloyl-ACP methyl ester carboxylesterase